MDVSAEADGKRRRGKGENEWVKVVCRAARATRRGLASPGAKREREREKKKRIKATVEDKIIIAR